MSVMCIMTFVIILGTVALTVTDAAHKNVVYQNKVQQAYYTAKSAAETTASYIMQHSSNKNATDGEMAKELYDIYDAYKADTTAAWSAGVNYIKGENSADTAIGSYSVDIYPTTNPNVFKIVANSNYQGITSSTAILVGPNSGGAGYDDAIVGTGSAGLSGSPQVSGGMTLNMPTISKNTGDIYVGGNVTNTGNIDFAELQHAFTTAYFESKYSSGLSIISSGNVVNEDGTPMLNSEGKPISNGDLSIGDIFTTRDINGNNDDADVWKYYSYLACKGNFKIKAWANKSPENHSFATKVTSEDKAILVGGDFITESVQYGIFDAPVYVGGIMNLQGAENIVFNKPVYIVGDTTSKDKIQIKGKVEFKEGLYIKDSSKVTEINITDTNGNKRDNNSFVHYGDDSGFEKYEQLLEQKLKIPKQKLDMYGLYDFGDHEDEMGLNGHENDVKNYKITNDSNNLASLKYTINGTETTIPTVGTYENNEITINDSGYITKFDLNSCRTGGVTVCFDTNDYSNGGYKDIYIRIATTDFGDANHFRDCYFTVKGKGNAYLYLEGDKRWVVNQCQINSVDEPGQPHFWLISNSENKGERENATIFFGGGTSGGADGRVEAYVYAPKTNIHFGGSTGFYGFVVGNKISLSSGSGVALEYVPPKNPDGSYNTSYSSDPSVSYSILLRTRN